MCPTALGRKEKKPVIKSIQSWKTSYSCWDIPDTRCKKRGKAEPLILAAGGMTSAGEGLPLSFWLQSKRKISPEIQFGKSYKSTVGLKIDPGTPKSLE